MKDKNKSGEQLVDGNGNSGRHWLWLEHGWQCGGDEKWSDSRWVLKVLTVITWISRKVEPKTTPCKQVVYWECRPKNQECMTRAVKQGRKKVAIWGISYLAHSTRGIMTWASVYPSWLSSEPALVMSGPSLQVAREQTSCQSSTWCIKEAARQEAKR